MYGFITVPKGILLDLIDHPVFQRLQRIRQLGFSYYVYPGAVHSRFNHALGAYHLMGQALNNLKLKGISISEEEQLAAEIAILLHDIGHGPFSHVLEHTLVPVHHEHMTEILMDHLNNEFNGQLRLSIEMFHNRYPRKFFNQLISSQLDVDRLDYLNRDSFFTGVAEGVIGYDRLIKMMDVVDEKLVLEEKALYSIEKFLMSRRIMYWQVYMHKTSLVAESMLTSLLSRFKANIDMNIPSPSLLYFLQMKELSTEVALTAELVENFINIDDTDIWQLIKSLSNSKDPIINYLSNGLIKRKLLKIIKQANPFDPNLLELKQKACAEKFSISQDDTNYLVTERKIEMNTYQEDEDEILIQKKDQRLVPLSQILDMPPIIFQETKYFIILPGELR